MVVFFRACVSPRLSNVRPLDPDSPAAAYIKEFHEYKFHPEGYVYEAPDGSAKIVDKNWFPSGCHTYWVYDGIGRSKIIRIGEREAGSGTNWSMGWSKDSQAVFFRGYQLPDRCGDTPVGGLDLIHTREDGKTWQLPSNE